MPSSFNDTYAKPFIIEDNIIKSTRRKFSDNFQIGKIIFDNITNNPKHVSQIEVESGRKTTFEEMKEKGVRCAVWMKKQNIGRHDVVVVRTNDSENTYIPIFATFFVGATFIPLNHHLPLEQTRQLLKDLKPKVLFISGNGTEAAVLAAKTDDTKLKVIVFDDTLPFQSLNGILRDQSDTRIKNFQPEIIISSEDIAYIILSSGSSTLPKCIVHTYGNLSKQIYANSNSMKHVNLWYSPTYWVTGFISLVLNIIFCKTRIIHLEFDPEKTSKAIEKYQVEMVVLSPPAVESYCRTNVLMNYELRSLNLVLVGGAKIHRRMLEKFHKSLPHVKVHQLLGCSEIASVMTVQTEACKNIYSVGFVAPGVEIKVRDLHTNEALGPNAFGELCVKSELLMKGYYKNEEATKKVIDAEGWYHTEDVVYYNEDGEFFIVDRIHDAINYKNQLIWPSQLEDILLLREDILEAVVVPVPHKIDGERPVAFVKKAPNANVSEKELIRALECLNKSKKLHVSVTFIEKLPRLTGGKFARKQLLEMARRFV